MTKFGRALRDARLRAGYKSAAQLAATLDVLEGTYRVWERGQSMPSLPMIIRLTHALSIEMTQLFPDSYQAAPPAGEPQNGNR